MRLRYNWIVLCFSAYISCYAQVAGGYCEKDALMYSECYWFDREQKTFIHESTTDDGQSWKGIGTYKENRTTISLVYEPISILPFNSLVVNPVTSDTAKVYWYNLWDEKQAWFQVLVFDSSGNKVWVQEAEEDVASIPKKYCMPAYTFQLMSEGWQKITTFTLDEKTDAINIYFNPPSLHSFKNPPLKLTKTKNGFKAWAMWAGKEKLFAEVGLPPIVEDFTNHSCFRNKNYSQDELLKKHPFNLADYIKIIAFEAKHEKIPLNSTGSLKESDCKQIIPLSQVQADSLMDLLYNYNYHDSLQIRTTTQLGCYDPRHAILFYSGNERPFAWLEICFTCWGYKTNIDKNNFGDFCDGKYELLKDFMKQSGITFFAEQDTSLQQVEEPIVK